MNSLSWFLYAADTIGNLKALLFTLLVVTGIAWGILNISVLATEGGTLEWKDFGKWWTRGVAVMLASAFIFVFLPAKNTMYAIAASQIGEQIASNDAVKGIANDATKALQQWIKKQIEPEK